MHDDKDGRRVNGALIHLIHKHAGLSSTCDIEAAAVEDGLQVAEFGTPR